MSQKNKKELSELKKRAILAKQRLKMGYWQKLENEMRKSNEEIVSVAEVQTIREKVKRDEGILLGREDVSRDEQFYIKVCEILDDDEDVINPIGQLIDKEKYEQMDEGNRQRYVLELSKKFREMRDRYYRERAVKYS